MGRKKVHAGRDDEQFLPDMGPVRNERVHRAARRYVKARDERIALSAKEKEAHDFLLTAMTEEGMSSYEYKGLAVYVDTKSKCKVEVNGEKKAEENGEEVTGE